MRWCRTRRMRTGDDEGQKEWEREKFISFENSLTEKYAFVLLKRKLVVKLLNFFTTMGKEKNVWSCSVISKLHRENARSRDEYKDGISKLFRSPGIDFARRAVRKSYSYSVPSPHRLLYNSSTGLNHEQVKTSVPDHDNLGWIRICASD
jgi:hypothetical protein